MLKNNGAQLHITDNTRFMKHFLDHPIGKKKPKSYYKLATYL